MIDPLIKFCLPEEIQGWLNQYKSPESECSIAKGIPNTEYNNQLIDRLSKIIKLRRKYRGSSKPGYNRPGAFCHKNYADTIALYPRTEYGPNGYTWMGAKI